MGRSTGFHQSPSTFNELATMTPVAQIAFKSLAWSRRRNNAAKSEL
jgi:hypothetical protein